MTKKTALQELKTELEIAIESYTRLPHDAMNSPATNVDMYAIICIILNLVEVLQKEYDESI